MYPQAPAHLSQADFSSPQEANNIFVNYLLRYDSVGMERLLLGDFWSISDLDGIYKTLQSSADANAQKIAVLVLDAKERKIALKHTDVAFRKGLFGAKLPWPYDFRTTLEIETNKQANIRFLTTSPDWRQMKGVIKPDLYAHLRKPDAAGEFSPSFNFTFYPQGPSLDGLAYFQSLGLEAQKDYIAKSDNINELARILVLQTPARAEALDRLMATAQGRLLVLQTYVSSTDPELNLSIEARDWIKNFRADIAAVRDPGENRIYRLALAKFNQEWAANMKMSTYTDIELHNLPESDPLKDAQIQVAALKRALEFYRQWKAYSWNAVPWTWGQSRSIEETRALANLQHDIDNNIDPRKTLQDFQAKSKALSSSMYWLSGDVTHTQKEIAANIRRNDQRIPLLPQHIQYPFLFLPLYLFYALTKSKIRDYKVKQANDEELLGMIYSEELAQEKLEDAAMSSVLRPPSRVYNSTADHFSKWYKIVARWGNDEQMPASVLLADFRNILIEAEEVLRDMPWSSDLIWNDHKDMVKNAMFLRTFKYFNRIAVMTLSKYKQLHVKDLKSTQKSQLEDDVEELFGALEYSCRFARILTFRSNIEKVMNYKFPDDDKRERVYPLIRWSLLLQPLWKRSEEQLKKELPLLLGEKSELIGELYQSPDKILAESLSRLHKVTTRALSYDSDYKMKVRRYRTRLWSFVGGLTLTAVAAVSTFYGVPLPVIGGLSVVGLGFLTATYITHWIPHIAMLKMKSIKDMDYLVQRLKGELKDKGLNIFNGPLAASNGEETDVQELDTQEGQQQLEQEMNMAHAPTVDMIVISSEDGENADKIRAFVRNQRGQLFRNDVPVLVLNTPYAGTGSAYLDLLKRVRNLAQSEDFKKEYPDARPLEESQVMFVFHGKEVSRDNTIQFPLLRQGIIKGYRAAGSHTENNGAGHKAGNTIIFTRDVYMGPMPAFPDAGILMLNSRVNSRVLMSGSLIDADFTGTGEIKKLWEGVNIRDQQDLQIRLPVEGKLLKDRYNIVNPEIKQYPIWNGILMLAPDAVKVYEKMAGYMDRHGLWEKLRLSLTSDLLNPVIIGNNHQEEDRDTEAEDFARSRVRWKNVIGGSKKPIVPQNINSNAIEPLVADYYRNLIKFSGGRLQVLGFMAPASSEIFDRVNGEIPATLVHRYVTPVQAPKVSFAMTSTPGGVDFSSAGDVMESHQAQNFKSPKDLLSGLRGSSLQSFQGFNFRVIQFRPIDNPAALLVAADGRHAGSWFSPSPSPLP